MSNSKIIATLREAGIRTVGDLDKWRESRGLGRWAALEALVGESAADRLLMRLAMRHARKKGKP